MLYYVKINGIFFWGGVGVGVNYCDLSLIVVF